MNILQKDDTIIESLSETQCFDFLCSLLKPLGLTLVINKMYYHHYICAVSLSNKKTIYSCKYNNGFVFINAQSAKEYFKHVLNDVICFEPPLKIDDVLSPILHCSDQQILNPYLGAVSIEELMIRKDMIS